MIDIVKRSAQLLDIKISHEAAVAIAKRSRRTPRLANRLLKRARDIVEVDLHKTIDAEVIEKLIKLLDIDDLGLTDVDKQYMEVIGKKYQNSPIGIETLSSSLSEDRRTIEEFIEPYLMQIGFVKKTPRGRVLTNQALQHLSIRIEQNASIPDIINT